MVQAKSLNKEGILFQVTLMDSLPPATPSPCAFDSKPQSLFKPVSLLDYTQVVFLLESEHRAQERRSAFVNLADCDKPA